MKRLLTRISKLLLSLTLVTGAFILLEKNSNIVCVKADGNVTLTASSLGLSNGAEWTGTTISPITFAPAGTPASSSNTAKYYSTGSGLRLYNGDAFVVSAASGYTITGGTFTFSGSGYTFSASSISAAGATYSESGTTGTLSDITASSVSIPVTRTCRLQSVVINYTGGGSSTSTSGTVDNPYTIAEARNALDASSPINNVYVAGIISQIDSYNSTYHSLTYWISDDGTTTDQFEVYSGKNLNNTNFTSTSDIEVGAEVVIFGNIKIYNTTYEFDKNNYLTSYTAPLHVEPTLTLSPSELEVVVSGGSKIVTAIVDQFTATPTISVKGTPSHVSCTVNGLSISLTAISAGSETVTIQAVNGNETDEATINISVYAAHGHLPNDPYTVAEGLAIINGLSNNGKTSEKVYTAGVISSITEVSTNNKNATYIIVDSGETSGITVFRGKYVDNGDFTSEDQIAVGGSVVVYGQLQKYVSNGNTTPEICTPNYLYSYEAPAAASYTVTYNANGGVGILTDDNSPYVDGTEVTVLDNSFTRHGYSFNGWNTQADGLGTSYSIGAKFSISENTTLYAQWTANPIVPGNFEKVTSPTELVEGSYLIVNEEISIAFNGGLATLDSVENTVSVIISDNRIANSIELNSAIFEIEEMEGGYSLCSASGQYIGQTSDSNGMKAASTVIANAISFTDGDADIVSGGAYLRFNNSSNQLRFRYYKSSSYSSQKPVQLYRFISDVEAVENFINEKLKWNSYETTHTAGQDGQHECLNYYLDAKSAFQDLTSNQQHLFAHTGDYASGEDTYAAQRQRYEDWAKAYGDATPYDADVTPIAGSKLALNTFGDSSNSTIIIVIVAITSISSLGVLLVIKRKRTLTK